LNLFKWPSIHDHLTLPTIPATISGMFFDKPDLFQPVKQKPLFDGAEQAHLCPTCQGSGRQYVCFVDIAGIPKKARIDGKDVNIRNLIKNRLYHRQSAEIYSSPPPGCPGSGNVFRRLVAMGGQLPQIKSLASLGDAKWERDDEVLSGVEAFAAGDHRNTGDPYSTADIDDLVSNFHLSKHFNPPPFAIGNPDKEPHDDNAASFGEVSNMYADWRPCKVCQGKGRVSGYNNFAEVTLTFLRTVNYADRNSFAIFSEVVRHPAMNYKEELEKEGFDKKVLEEMPDKHAEHIYSKFAEMSPPDKDEDEKKAMEKARCYMERFEKKSGPGMVKKFMESAGFKKAEDIYTMGVLDKNSEEYKERERQKQELAANKLETRKLTVDTFCERMIRAGTMIPAQLDRSYGGPNWADLLNSLPDVPVVHKFSEGGKEITKELSPFELAKSLIEKGPNLVRFGEKVVTEKEGEVETNANLEAEKEKVRQHYQKNASVFKTYGITEKDRLDVFSEQVKKDPEYTAERFLTPNA